VSLGGRTPRESYLRQDAIIEAAATTGAEAVHPGYGFLAENAAFNRAVTDAGLVFVGPSADAMDALGDKVKAREAAEKVDVPISPGSDGPVAHAKAAAKVAEAIGYPVLFKAAAGGGGMGMRLVASPDDLGGAWAEASAQAESAFGDGRLLIERFHARPRHVEIQLLGLESGAIHLGERECSIQRRYQKLIEEAPSPAVDDALRAEIGEAAVRLADSVGYQNAGTAEFLLTGEGHFFNEINARLQVEHPVTEMVTGVDLVAEQLRIAAGDEPATTRTPELRGHAFEFRVNAEDPLNHFVPNPGPLRRYREPQGPFVRVDSGVREGGEVAREYDSLVAKLIVWGRDREEARHRSLSALRGFEIEGIETTLPFHIAVCQEPHFARGELSTTYLDDVKVIENMREVADDTRRARLARVAAVAATLYATDGLYAVARQRPLRRGAAATWTLPEEA